jgi:hypothetical protein
LEKGASVTLSTLRSTVHLGAHADGPNHYGVGAPSIDQRSLEYYLGPCQVVGANVKRGERVTTAMLSTAITERRVLIATRTYPDPFAFNEDFAALDPDLIDALHDQGVMTIGIDTPSVDLFSSKDLAVARAIPGARHGDPRGTAAGERAGRTLRADRAAAAVGGIRRESGTGGVARVRQRLLRLLHHRHRFDLHRNRRRQCGDPQRRSRRVRIAGPAKYSA